RDSFEPQRGFSRVLSQQGRLTLDADLNELQSIQLHLLRTLARDLIGPDGGEGFLVDSTTTPVARNFAITKGRYYVDGFLCENRGEVFYQGNGASTRPRQPYFRVTPQSDLELGNDSQHLVLLDVWERHVSFAETDGRLEMDRRYPPLLREVALGGPDTASRAQVVWQVKTDELREKDRGVVLTTSRVILPQGQSHQLTATRIGAGTPAPTWTSNNVAVASVTNTGVVNGVSVGTAVITVQAGAGITDTTTIEVVAAGGAIHVDEKTPAELRKQVLAILRWEERLDMWEPSACGSLRADAGSAVEDPKEPCIVAPKARYRGIENQLYRVEVHNGGTVGKATFKWSRENASVVFGVSSIAGNVIKLSNWWRDARLGIGRGDLVEVLDDDVTLHQKATPLCRVVDIDQDARTVTLDATPDVKGDDPGKHTIIRRWDHRGSAGKSSDHGTLEADRALRIEESNTDWIALEDGVRVQFVPATAPAVHVYQTGGYWLIPARTALADVVWHRDGGAPVLEPPRGIDHHFAPLAIVAVDGAGKVERLFDLRRLIPAIT
ncbi:MAG TPA: DUF6519 domain-containing protein, partial [Gemmatimonadaceae bacterium]|nr:DUF6519 domain-containing protein [Gemmatimonadaceae bacterium]